MDYTLLNAYFNTDFYTRYPKDVITSLGYKDHVGGKDKAYDMTGVEIRYLSDKNNFNILLDTVGEGYCTLYIGDYSITRIKLISGTNHIINPIHDRYLELKNIPSNNYPNNLFRIILESGYKLKNIKVLDDTSSPYLSSNKHAVFYGSSFTQGSGSLIYPYCYVNITKELLGIDILNKGLSGNCLCEFETADFLASLNPDFYVLELGCNMRGCMDSLEFEKRIDYLFKTLKETDKPIFVISSLAFFVKEFSIFDNQPYKKLNLSFTKILRKLTKEYQIKLIPMTKLMTDFNDVSYDMLHPSLKGHLNIAYNLSKILKRELKI